MVYIRFLYVAMLMYCVNVLKLYSKLKQPVVPFEGVCELWYLH